MTARILDGRPVAEAVWKDAEREAELLGRPPSLALVQSDDPASAAYGAQIERQFHRHGFTVSPYAPLATESELRMLLASLGADPAIDGVLVMSPLPAGLDTLALSEAIPPHKD